MVDQSVLGAALAYGTVTVVGSGGTRERFTDMVDPQGLRTAVLEAANPPASARASSEAPPALTPADSEASPASAASYAETPPAVALLTPGRVLGAVGAFYVGCIGVSMMGSNLSPPSGGPASSFVQPAPAPAFAERPPVQDERPVPPVTRRSPDNTSFGDGVWEVGVDLKPEKYKTVTPSGQHCYWAKLKDDDQIIDNDNLLGPTTVTIGKNVPKFESHHCGTWSLEGAAPQGSQADTFSDGVWEVGSDIQPGKYKADPPGDSCYWAKLRDNESIINNDNVNGPVTVTIPKGVPKFKSNGCGTWVRSK